MKHTCPLILAALTAFSITQIEVSAESGTPAAKWAPGHYVFVGIDPGPITEKVAAMPQFRGVQKAYNWNKIEVARDRYDWSEIDADLKVLAAHGKRLAMQIQFKTFQKGTTAVPAYIVDGEAEFGAGRTYLSHKEAIYPSIWNPKVAARLHRFIRALGQRYDANPDFGFVNLPETATSPVSEGKALGYTPNGFIEAVKQNMTVLAEAFPRTVKAQYINYGPPGALKTWAEHGARLGVGLGGPDLHPDRPIPSYPILKAYSGRIPIGIAVQHEDYYVTPKNHASGMLDLRRTLAFAHEIKVNYLFWNTSPHEGFIAAQRLIPASTPAEGLSLQPPARF